MPPLRECGGKCVRNNAGKFVVMQCGEICEKAVLESNHARDRRRGGAQLRKRIPLSVAANRQTCGQGPVDGSGTEEPRRTPQDRAEALQSWHSGVLNLRAALC